MNRRTSPSILGIKINAALDQDVKNRLPRVRKHARLYQERERAIRRTLGIAGHSTRQQVGEHPCQ
jgi:hypothetical protein